MKPLVKGCVIREIGYLTHIDSIITSEVVYNDKGQAMFTSETLGGIPIEYQKNPASLEVLSYPCRDCGGSGLFYQIEDCVCHCQEEK